MSINDLELTPEWLERRIVRMPWSGCWIWMGARYSDGYGRWAPKPYGPKYRAHRISYRIFNGPFDDAAHVCHRCDVPLCVNPGHLFLGDPAKNMRDKVNKGRHLVGSSVGNSKLKEHQVKEIRQSTARVGVLAKLYGVQRATIWRVISGTGWKHV